MEWQSCSWTQMRPLAPLPLWDTVSALAGVVCYLCDIILGHVPKLTSIYDQNKLGSSLPILPSVTPEMPSIWPSTLPPNHSRTRPWLSPTLNTTHRLTPTSLLWSKPNCKEVRISICARWVPRQERKGTTLIQYGDRQEFTSWEPLSVGWA